MFLSCSYFLGDFSLDVLIKGVLIKKKGVDKNWRYTPDMVANDGTMSCCGLKGTLSAGGAY